MVIDWDARKVEWDGDIPRAVTMNIEKNFKALTRLPRVYLNLALAEQYNNEQGLRPHSEIYNLVQKSLPLKLYSLGDEYMIGQ